MRILVTGGAGFIGSNLCKKLDELGHTVYSLDNYTTGSEDNHIKNVEYQIGHTKNIKRYFNDIKLDLIYHLGEYSRVEQSFDDIEKVFEYNTVGTFEVLQFCVEKKCKLIYAGSSTKFSDIGSSGSPYAFSKAQNTELVKNYGKWFDLKYAITYFYNVYGKNEISEGKYSTVIAKFKKLYNENKPMTVVRPGTQKRNFTYINDIIDGLVIIGREGEGDGYGIGSDKSYSLSEVASLFSKDIIMLPERKGNRIDGSLETDKTKALGWSAEMSLAGHIAKFKLDTLR